MDDVSPLDTYVSKPDPEYKWFDTQQRLHMISGSTGYVLNVTSQRWLDISRVTNGNTNTAVWSHQALVLVPKNLTIKTKAFIYITGSCNPGGTLDATDSETLAIDHVSQQVGAIAVVLHQVPNCPLVFPSDPRQKRRGEDSLIAWAWKQFIDTQDPEWLPRLPMVKSAMQAMRAVQEYTTQAQIASIDGWLVAGASKRGWTTWMVGAVNCPTCPRVVGIAPVVPIVPDIRTGMHHMWRAFSGFTFAFSDYIEVNLTQYIDDDRFLALTKIVDPIHYVDRLARLPKIVSVSSDDEFMMFEWTSQWWDKFTGEKHLMIAQNAEHSMATGIVELVKALSCFASSVFRNGARPEFTWVADLVQGTITVKIPDQFVKGAKVVLRHATTLSSTRRDFRWAIAAQNTSGKPSCTLPTIGPIKLDGSDICANPIIWWGTDVAETSPGTFVAQIPKAKKGWTGAFVEVMFPSDTGLVELYRMTTSGVVFEDTLPFPDCVGAGCIGRLV